MKARVLLVDEDEAARHSLVSWLVRKGCRAFPAADPAEAWQCLQARPVDVVVVSAQRDGQGALSLLRDIKRVRPETEVILVTGPGQIPLSIQAMKSGAFDDLAAPVDVDALSARIEAAFKKRRKRRPSFSAWMAAVTFAEAGEPETAKAFLGMEATGVHPVGLTRFLGAVGLSRVQFRYGLASLA
jgi:DNA-binding NtrC family response regulator